MSSTNIGVDELNKASSIATLILTFGSFIPGCIGHILNVIIFVRPSLRCHSCTNYFLSSSIVSLFLMLIVLPVRMHQIVLIEVYLIGMKFVVKWNIFYFIVLVHYHVG